MKQGFETIARAIAPEDVRVGAYIAVLNVVGEYLPLFCADEAAWKKPQIVRVLWLPWMPNEPLKVKAVCLPFVHVTTAGGESRTLDVRRYRLAQVPEKYARKVWKRMRRKTRKPRLPLSLDED